MPLEAPSLSYSDSSTYLQHLAKLPDARRDYEVRVFAREFERMFGVPLTTVLKDNHDRLLPSR